MDRNGLVRKKMGILIHTQVHECVRERRGREHEREGQRVRV